MTPTITEVVATENGEAVETENGEVEVTEK